MSCGLWKETVAVAEDYMRLRCSSPHPAPPPPSESAAAMRRLAQDMETQHQARFQSLAQGFVKHGGTDLCSNLRKVMDELAGDGLFNWGRVVALFTFAGVLARQLHEQRGENPVPDHGKQPELQHEPVSCRELAETIADYLEKHKKDWLQENNGWVSAEKRGLVFVSDESI